MKALSLDTATGVLSLCAANGDQWACLSVDRGLQHSPALIPLADRLLGDLGITVADLELVVCSTGPGSFTGIRIGIATALGIGQGRGIPVVGVSTLDALGRSWEAYPGDVFPVIDARRGNIYTARYNEGMRQGDYLDISPADFTARLAQSESPLLVGPDAPRVRALLGDPHNPPAGGANPPAGGANPPAGGANPPLAARMPLADMVDPRSMLRIGVQLFLEGGADTAPPQPLYLRRSEAERVSGR